MSARFTRRVLIPAAGFGKRAGGAPAKELLIDPESGAPLIEFALSVAASLDAEPAVITRHDKQALIEYLSRRNIPTHLTGPTREWPETLLNGKSLWGDANVVLLPDTVFSPRSAAHEIFSRLDTGAAVSFAVFEAAALDTWGAVWNTDCGWLVAEKPKGERQPGQRAWGVFGFRRGAGEALLDAMLRSGMHGTWEALGVENVPLVRLESFEDRTR